MSDNGNIGNRGGNTKTPRVVPCKKWCFTLNNYTNTLMEQLETKFKEFNIDYIFGEEVGESGTKHLQGYIECPTKIRPIEKFGIKEIHWEKTKGTREQNITYCSKDGKVKTSFMTEIEKRKRLRILSQDQLYDWQKDIIECVKKPASDREIIWVWSHEGKTGKTTFGRYLAYEHKASLVKGKGKDILYAATTVVSKDPFYDGYIFILDLCRTMENFVSYEGIEDLKNGWWFSGKYESVSVIIPPPHVIVFANFKPDVSKLSKDRWKIVNID